MQDKAQFIQRSRELYRRTLLEDVVPFWMKHGRDERHGGISNILDDEGNLLGTDKYTWSQGRALWTFSALYRRIEKRPEWLAFADRIYRYLASRPRTEQGAWMFRFDGEGNTLDRDISIYADAFALNGLGEYYAASGNEEGLQLALATYESTWERINSPGSYGLAPYSVPEGMKPLGVPMVFSFFYSELARAIKDGQVGEAAVQLAHEVLDDFYVPEKDAILEMVSQADGFVDSPAGRTCIPGHCIEALWFLMSIFEGAGDHNLVQACCRLIRRHLELGWDKEYDGVRLALDIDGQEPLYWKNPDCKPWWVQIEALVATAYAYRHTREDWCLEWHKRLQDYAFSHYPVSSGEWTQWLDRQGNKMQSQVLPVKDPFHLPRGLIYLLELFNIG